MSVWIDLTDFLKWTGNLTGIQRIQYNLSKKYIDSGRDVHFFVYDESRRIFEKVDFIPEAIVSHGIIGSSADNLTIKQTNRYVSKLVHILQRTIKTGGNQKTPIINSGCPFSHDDIILVMGGIWVGNFIEDLSVCKQKYNFRFIHFAFDMIPSLFPGYVVDWLPGAFNSYQEKVFSIAEGIISISESTKHDVLQFIKERGIANSPLIQTVRIGEDIEGDNNYDNTNPPELLKEKVNEEFILTVSTFEARKNYTSLFYVIKEAKLRGVKIPKIIIVGRDGWLTDNIRYAMAADRDALESITILNNVNDRELDWLYKNCRFTIFPSFYEGWGMPVAESLSYGKLCLSSNTSSMPEIAGDLIEYFSPYNTGEILEKITKYLDDSVLKAKVNKIESSYHRTSWNDMFIEVSSFVDSFKN